MESDQRFEQANDILDESLERDQFTAQEAKNEFKEFMEQDERKTKDQKESDNLSDQEAFNKLINTGYSTSLWDKLIEAREQRFEVAKEQVDEFTWDEKSLEEKMAAIEHVGEYISTELLNLKEPPTIKFYNEEPFDGNISCGKYTKENNTVFINQYLLDYDVQVTVETLGHELKHAKQYEMKEDWDRTQRFKMFRSRVENRVQSLLANPNFEPVKDWSRNLGRNILGQSRYIKPRVNESDDEETRKKQFHKYKNQPVELDADNYEAKIRRMFFGNKKRY